MPSSSALNEQNLFQQVAQGDAVAFRSIYDSYFNRLSAYIFKFCKSETATEDIIQDIFIRLWVNRTNLAGVEIPEAYIFSMARNRAIDYLRTLAKHTNLIDILTQQPEAHTDEIEEKLAVHELNTLIEEALKPLSEQKKKVFRLNKIEGLSHDEIAEQMQLSKSTIKNHLSETLQHIRQHLLQRPGSEASLLLLWIISFR